MKQKVIFTLFLATFSLLFGLEAFSQRNSFAFGDKTEAEIQGSIQTFDVLIADYEAQIKALQKENEKILFDFLKSPDYGEEVVAILKKRSYLNDSLMMVYRLKGLELRETKQYFLEMTAGNSKKKRVSSRGNNPEKLREAANAYAMMSYVDAYTSGVGKAGGAGEVAESGLKGLITNNWYQEVTVTVSGPGSWQRQFQVARNGGKVVFDVPYPGQYTFIFTNGRDASTVIKECRPGMTEFFDLNGQKYDLMATLPRGY